jgi:hypothetical protein
MLEVLETFSGERGRLSEIRFVRTPLLLVQRKQPLKKPKRQREKPKRKPD